MALHAQTPTPATGDHWAVIDSGKSKHVLLEHIYLANATEDHTAVAGFSGQTSRATHRGDFTATVRTATGNLIHITDVDSALVIPDAIRTLYSVRKSLQSGNTIRFDANAGLLVKGRPDFFVPFVRDSSTDLFLLPLLVPPTRHNGVYGIYNATTTQRKDPSSINFLKQAQTTAEKSSAQKQYLTDHHRFGHAQQQRLKDIIMATSTASRSSANVSSLTQAAPPALHPKAASQIVLLPQHLPTEQWTDHGRTSTATCPAS
jgi:hypothetical protein